MEIGFNARQFFLRVAWVSLTLGFILTANANVVPDSSFESGTSSWFLQDGTASFVSSPVHNGVVVLKMVNAGNGIDSPPREVHQQKIAGIVAGKEYIYDVWVSGKNLQGIGDGGKPLGVVRWRDGSGKIVTEPDGKYMESYVWAPYGTYDFQKLTLALQAPSNASTVDILFRTWWGTIAGESYWDDVSLSLRDFSGRGSLVATYQAENAELLFGGTIKSQSSDYSGSGYYDIETNNAVIQWSNVVGGGSRVLSVKYSWEGNEQEIQLYVNGVSQGTRKPLATGHRGTWASDLWNVNLPEGNSTIKLVVGYSGDGEKTQPMIDKLDVYDPNIDTSQPPTLSSISAQTIAEANLMTVDVLAIDTDSPTSLILTQTNTLPGNPDVLTDFGSGVGEIRWTPALGSAADSPYSITVKATDGTGAFASTTVNINVLPQGGISGQAPYGGTPAAIPGRIETERYDVGGSDVAYYDTGVGNDGLLIVPTAWIFGASEGPGLYPTLVQPKRVNGWNIPSMSLPQVTTQWVCG